MEIPFPAQPEEHADDAILIARMRTGDAAALGELYSRWHRPIYRFALHMSGRPEVAEDVTQEVFLDLIQGCEHFQDRRGQLSLYLFGSARNRLRRWRREGRRETGEPPAPVVSAAPGPDMLLTLSQNAIRVHGALLLLPHRYREAVVLCDLQELSYGEAAAALHCRVGTVRSRLHRGRALLAKKLGPSTASRTHAACLAKEPCLKKEIAP